MSESKVYIVTVGQRQKDDTFTDHINGVFSTMEKAKAHLDEIETGNNKDEPHLIDWRARRPIGQPNDLSVDLLVNGFYQCQSFYRINQYEVE